MPPAELAKLRMTSVSFVNELYGDDETAKRRACQMVSRMGGW